MIIFLSLSSPLPGRGSIANVAIWMLKYKYAYKSGPTIKRGGHDSQWGTISESGDILGHHVWKTATLGSWKLELGTSLDSAQRCRISMSIKSHENVAKMNRSVTQIPHCRASFKNRPLAFACASHVTQKKPEKSDKKNFEAGKKSKAKNQINARWMLRLRHVTDVSRGEIAQQMRNKSQELSEIASRLRLRGSTLEGEHKEEMVAGLAQRRYLPQILVAICIYGSLWPPHAAPSSVLTTPPAHTQSVSRATTAGVGRFSG